MVKMEYKRIFLAANRSAIEYPKDPDTIPDLINVSTGGLLTGMTGLDFLQESKEDGHRLVWFGSAGPYANRRIDKNLKIAYDRGPFGFIEKKVFMNDETYEGYKKRVCDGFKWPLFHCDVKGVLDSPGYHRPELKKEDYIHYITGNLLFTGSILDEFNELPDSILWSHDYHLMLVPRMIRNVKNDAKIGHFMHTPFFNIDIPEVKEIVDENLELMAQSSEGLLGADLLGFQIPPHQENFVKAIEYFGDKGCLPGVRIMQEGKSWEIEYDGHITRVEAFPIGLNIERIDRGAKSRKGFPYKDIGRRMKEAEEKGAKIIVDVGRMDYKSEGSYIIEGLLERGNVLLYVDVSQLSRKDSPGYPEFREFKRRRRDEINQKYKGSLGFEPYLLHEEGINYPHNIQIFRNNICFFPQKSGGKELVIEEAVRSRKGLSVKKPVIAPVNTGAHYVLSRFGAKDGIVWIDPLDVKGSVEKIEQHALKEPVFLNDELPEFVGKNSDVRNWGRNYIDFLLSLK